MYSNDECSSFSYDAFRRSCPSHAVLDALSGKWTYLILVALRRGTLRNSDIARLIEGISPKMLSQSLRSLERDGLVTRTIHAEVPPRVEYALTPLGQDLAGLMNHIRLWAEAHVPQIHAARAAYGGQPA
jgi:DNA-binding HxlR family transcriptional regulator